MYPPPDTVSQDNSVPTTLFESLPTPYAAQPLLCLRPPTVLERAEAPMLKLSTTGVGWGLELPADDPCRWLTAPITTASFLHYYGTSYQWRLRDLSLWTTDTILHILQELPAHSYALVELSHVLHSIPTSVFVRLLTSLTRLCRPGGVLRWIEGSWLQAHGPLCVQAMTRVRQLASERACGCPDTDHATMGNVSVLPALMQHWLTRMSSQPVGRLGASLHITEPQQETDRQALARCLPFWLRNMSEETIKPADACASARWQQWHQRVVDEILQPSFTATCTLHVLWTRPVEEENRC